MKEVIYGECHRRLDIQNRTAVVVRNVEYAVAE